MRGFDHVFGLFVRFVDVECGVGVFVEVVFFGVIDGDVDVDDVVVF